jgi:hypothetical protein
MLIARAPERIYEACCHVAYGSVRRDVVLLVLLIFNLCKTLFAYRICGRQICRV